GHTVEEVVAVAAGQGVVPLAAGDGIVPGAAVDGQPDQIGGQARGIHHVVTAEGVHRQRVPRRLRVDDVHDGGGAHVGADAGPVVEGRDLADVGSFGAVDDDSIGLAVEGEVEVDLADVGRGQVVDGDRVGAVAGVEVDHLDAVEVQGDVADVAGEPDAMDWRANAAVRDGELVRVVRAAERQRVPAAPSFDHGVAA